MSVENLEARVDAIVDRLSKLESRQDDLEKLISVIAAMQKDIEYQSQSIERIEKSVKELAEKPGKRWETAVGAVITGVVGLLLGFLTRYL